MTYAFAHRHLLSIASLSSGDIRAILDVVNTPVEHSSTQKAETLWDTVMTLDAMQTRSVIREQVEMGVAVRMAVLDLLLIGGVA